MMGASGNSYDVIVVGLGGMGSAAAAHLARRGQRVLGLERFTPPHDRGASHGGSRIIRLAYLEDPAYVPLLQRAYDLWGDLEQESERELMLVTGGLWLGPPGSRAVVGAQQSAEQWGLAHEVLDAAATRARFPTLAPDDDTVAVYEPTAGILRPEATVEAHMCLATTSGADLHFLEPVTSWRAGRSGGGVEVATDRATYRAGRLVICPGGWASELLEDMRIPFMVERAVQSWFQPEGGVSPFLPDRHPVWIWEPRGNADAKGLANYAYGVPALDGPAGGVKMCVATEGAPCNPDAVERTIGNDEMEAIATAVRPHFTAALTALRANACMWTNTPDRHFVVGTHPGHPDVIVAAGFSGHGFKFVPVMGEILADLAVDGTTSHPIRLFDPGRLTP